MPFDTPSILTVIASVFFTCWAITSHLNRKIIAVLTKNILLKCEIPFMPKRIKLRQLQHNLFSQTFKVKYDGKMKGEKRFYSIVKEWLEKNGYYCGGYITKGRKTFSYFDVGSLKYKVDVAGVKNVGNKFIDVIEIVAVEVKDEELVKHKHMQQALGYSSIAHKCYLATTAKITEDDKANASRMGIGLLQLTDKDSMPKEILSPQLKQPNEASMLDFLDTLSISQCTICKCYFFNCYWDSEGKKINSYKRIRRSRQFDVYLETKLDPFHDLPKLRGKLGKLVTRRFICKSCFDGLLKSKEKP